MCGIAGVIGSGVAVDALERALDALGHRGPDDQGWLLWSRDRTTTGGARDAIDGRGQVALLHARLSILDLSAHGHQPMSTADGRHHLIFNGEIYNYVELRKELEDLGHHFESSGDTEVLLAALVTWGTAALPRLVGMFALALLDTAEGTVLLARDPFGIKPLFYRHDRGRLAFASEIAALLELGGERRLNAGPAYDYLRWGLVDHGAATMFEGVHHLPAGTYLRVSTAGSDAAELQEYWHLPEERVDLAFEEATRQLRDAFLTSIELHLRSDVPIGAALSGGIDSSAIVCAARHVNSALDLHTFSYIADDPRISEARWVERVVSATGCTSHEVRVDGQQLVGDLDALVRAQGEPFGSTSIYAQRAVFETARRNGVIVLLDGQGADELFAGYGIYLGARVRELVRQGHLLTATRLVVRIVRQAGAGLIPQVAARSAASWLPAPARRRALALADRDAFPGWLDEDWFTARGVTGEARARSDDLSGSLHDAFSSTRLPALLRYEDRNSMSFSLESRVPFLTPDLVRLVFGLPAQHLVAEDGTQKSVFRAAMRGIVPDEILDRRDKIGFSTPEVSWLSSNPGWVASALQGRAGERVGPITLPDPTALLERAARHPRRYDGVLWRLINLTRWAELYDVDVA